MPAYEAMFIFKPEINEQEEKLLVTELEKLLKENQANIENSQAYGRRQLAYPINKCSEGIYYLINFSTASSDAVPRLKHACKINERILRALVTRTASKEEKNG
ncbi:MAG: 30S ribosomal protein S6 [Candidatus Omnitrophica bacterium]|nr:30S ribosomal protein S6 [Candidatus Omnitrophota bacterium]